MITFFCTVNMGKGVYRVYKHSQHNWTYPSPNTTFGVPSISDNTTFQVTTGKKFNHQIFKFQPNPYNAYKKHVSYTVQ